MIPCCCQNILTISSGFFLTSKNYSVFGSRNLEQCCDIFFVRFKIYMFLNVVEVPVNSWVHVCQDDKYDNIASLLGLQTS